MISKDINVTVLNEGGEHPIANLVQVANRFESTIHFDSDGYTVNGKSIMGMMTLGMYPGEPVSVTIEGADENAAMEAIEEYLNGTSH